MNPIFLSHQKKRYPIYHPVKAKLTNEPNDLEYKRIGQNESNKSVAFERTFDPLPSSSQLPSDDCFSHNQASSTFYEKSFPSALKPSRRQNPISLEDALKSEKAFVDYVMSFPNRESMHSYSDNYTGAQVKSLTIHDISKASNTCGKNKLGFEHLDNLCKLMQQLGELREANVKLQRKVQYLEEVKPTHESSLLLSTNSHNRYNSNLELSNRAGSYLTIAHVNKDESDECDQLIQVNVPRSPCFSKDRKSRMLKSKAHFQEGKGVIVRERSKSVGYEEQLKNCDNIVTTSGHCELRESSAKSPKRIPTWSKVKEALGLEKHHSSQLRSNSQVNLTNTNSDRASEVNKMGFKKLHKSFSKNPVHSTYQFEKNPNQINDQILKSRSFSSGFEGYLNEEFPCYDNSGKSFNQIIC